MLRIGLAVVIAAVVQFTWGFVFWMVLPISKQMVQKLPGEDTFAAALKDVAPESGVYFLPYADCSSTDPEVQAKMIASHKAGPLVQIIYRKEGIDPTSGATFGMGFLHCLTTSLLAALLLVAALPNLRTFFARLAFVIGLGLFATVTVNLAGPVWFHHPWKFPLYYALFDLGCWTTAGIALAAILRPSAAQLAAGLSTPSNTRAA